MGTLVGIILVVVAAATIIGVMWVVMQEKHTHEEHYIPPRTSASEAPGAPSTTGPASVREIVAENVGTDIPPSPEADRAEHDDQTTQA